MTALDSFDRGPTDLLPVDAPLVIAYAVAVAALVVSGTVAGVGRILLTAPLVVFLPGYVALSALFPGDRPADADRPSAWRLPLADGLGWLERVSLSVPVSVAVLPVLAILLDVSGVPFEPTALIVSITAFVVLVAAVGAVRRATLPDGARYDVPLGRWREEAAVKWGSDDKGLLKSRRPTPDVALEVVLAVVVVLAVSAFAVGLAAPADGESYTEAALLTPGSDGPVAGNYPESVEQGQPTDLLLTLENQLGAAQTYEVVVTLDRVDVSNNGQQLTVLERSVLSRFTATVEDGRTVRRNLDAQPDLVGDNLRMSVFVYKGEAPQSPSAAGAEEHLYLWMDVTGSGSGSAAEAGSGSSGADSSGADDSSTATATTTATPGSSTGTATSTPSTSTATSTPGTATAGAANSSS